MNERNINLNNDDHQHNIKSFESPLDKRSIIEIKIKNSNLSDTSSITSPNRLITHEIFNENGKLTIKKKVKLEIDNEEPVSYGKYINCCQPIPTISLNVSIILLFINMFLSGIGTMIVGCVKHYDEDENNVTNFDNNNVNEEYKNKRFKRTCFYFWYGFIQLLLIGNVGQLIGFLLGMCLVIKAKHYQEMMKQKVDSTNIENVEIQLENEKNINIEINQQNEVNINNNQIDKL